MIQDHVTTRPPTYINYYNILNEGFSIFSPKSYNSGVYLLLTNSTTLTIYETKLVMLVMSIVL